MLPNRRRPRGLLAAIAALSLAAAGRTGAREQTPPAGGEGPPARRARASIAWLSSPELDLVGEVEAEFPWAIRGPWTLRLSLGTITAIERTAGRATFVVRDLAFSAHAAAERRVRGSYLVSAVAGVQGIENVDRDGGADVRYLGAAAESPGFRGMPHRSGAVRRAAPAHWRVLAGVVLADRGIEASGLACGELLLGRCPETRPCLRGALSSAILRSGDSWRSQRRAGIRFDLPAFEAGRFSLFGAHLRSRHPFGLRTSGFLVGVEAEDHPVRPTSGRRSDFFLGRAAVGAGGGREAARLKLLLRSPDWSGPWRALLDLDTHVLTGRDPGELYSLVRVGVEKVCDGFRTGVYLFHRSNHRLAEPGDEITSLNVAEGGIETAGWEDRWPAARTEKGARWDARLRAGAVLSSAFGERDRWHVLAAGRLLYGIGRRPTPLAEVEIEEGEVGRRLYAVGLVPADGTELRIEYRSDEQFHGSDRTALLLVAAHAF